jgi:hypothetical protein
MSGLLVILVALALAASADPDPPQVDGGNVTFDGDWTVDPGDSLVYVNQTVVLNGNLTISPTGVLDLVNCTVYLNGTKPPGDWPMTGIRVGWNGTLNVTAGSLVSTWHLAKFIADPGAHLLIEDSTVSYIGHTAPLENSGLYSRADDTVVRRSNILGGNRGLILDGVNGALVEDVGFLGASRVGLYMVGGTSNVTLRNLTFTDQMESIGIVDCQSVNMTNISIRGPTYGISLDNATVNVTNGRLYDVLAEGVKYLGMGIVQWVVDGESMVINSTLEVNGSIIVTSGGTLTVDNSTVSIANPSANGINNIDVGTGGNMTVGGGSTIMSSAGGFRYMWTVGTGGHLVMDNATVSGAGWDPASPGLVLLSTGNVVNGTTFSDCQVGISVLGNGNFISQVTFDACFVGTKVTGSNMTLTDLTFTNGTRSGLVIEGTVNVTVVGIRLLGPLAYEAVHATASRNLILQDVNITGSVNYGIQLSNVSDALITVVDLRGSIRCVNIYPDLFTRSSNITVEAGSLQGDFPMEVRGADRLFFRNLLIGGGASGVATFQSVDGLVLESCQFRGDANVILLNVNDVTFDRCQFQVTIEASITDGLEMFDCFIQLVDTGVIADEVGDIDIRGLSVLNVTKGLVLTDCSNTSINDSLFTNVVEAGLSIADQSGCLVVNISIVSADVGVNITGGDNCTISDIGLFNVRIGIRISSGGIDLVLENSILSTIPVALTVTTGSHLTIVDSSFYDCPLAIGGDISSNVSFETSVQSEIVNSNCTHKGWYTVMAPGSLKVSSSRIHFLGWNSSHSGMRTHLGSTLNILSQTIVEGTEVPFSIAAAGSLVVRASTVIGGGESTGTAALASSGAAAVIMNVTFQDCELALSLAGSDPTVSDSVFVGNRQSILLGGVQRLRLIGCTFSQSNASWDIQGNFTSSLQIITSSFEGNGSVFMSMWLESPDTMASVLTLTNVSVSNYTLWGLQDDHHGSVKFTDCVFTYANVSAGASMNDGVTITGLKMVGSELNIGEGGFSLTDSSFKNSSLHVHDNSRGSLLTRCSFIGTVAEGEPTILVDGSIQITIRDLDLTGVGVGFHVSGGSEVDVSGVILDGATVAAVEVNGSIVRLEGCRLRGVSGSGIKIWNVGSRLEFRNGTIQAQVGRTGYDVDASNGGDAWLLNTTFDRTSVNSTGAGRVEVAWHVTVEPVLPWGGNLWDPDFLTVTDASGIEVLNTSYADGVLRLYQFGEEDGVRTMRTPHTFNVSDVQEGIRYSGAHTINASLHLILYLNDVASPVARAGPDQVVDENLKVTLDATGSSDNDATFHRTGSFRWEFDEYGNQVVMTGDVVSYVFSVPGKFVVSLTVWDVAGNIGTDTVIIQVRDRTPPVIRFGGNVTVDEDEWFIFDASGTTDNDPNFDFTTGTFLWRMVAGTEGMEWETATFGNAFPDPGNFSGTLTVWDKAGNMAREEFWVQVNDITPPVIVGVNNAIVFSPSQGLLDATQCFDNMGIVSFHWTVRYVNWSGDRDEHTELQGATPSYNFDRLATYNITLTISDAAGNLNTTEVWVVFDDVPTISLPSWAVSMADEMWEVPIDVFDVYFTDLRIDIIDGPEGCTIEGQSLDATLAWTPGTEWAGADVSISLEVYDGFISSEASITLHVNNARGDGKEGHSIHLYRGRGGP